MEVVAQHLRHEAVVRLVDPARDTFGRSSFNRFYYAAFLRVRTLLATLNSVDWVELPHADMPALLRGKVRDRLAKGRRAAQRADDAPLVQACNVAIAAIAELASVLDKGRMTRVTADYQPEVAVDFSVGSNFTLNTVSVQLASEWPTRAEQLCRVVEAAWRQIGD